MKTSKCNCQHCSQKVEFNIENDGQYAACPACGMDTLLFAPPTTPITPAKISKARESGVAKSTLICSYILSLLMPFAGFFAGIYLTIKKETGHGITCIALSIVTFAGLLALAQLLP